ncbi:hypothetical protein [Hafnia paralvei]|uniref:hypothetical protein n=1 Tax=Hafnia paralvei TaxID=546367 RepID=UPI001033AD9D|nr:hypothetical protein [Hafnia paralvei]TBL57369.1 hypothetical protein EYY97_18050 [Hafnia paralvei]TBL64159.1 hypothetical protein EYY97_04990 [Hafnia paralvei]TBL64167.1 hypothetical protein EYY97_04955 [Hafnia paralvei]
MRQVLIYADRWPTAIALQALCQQQVPQCKTVHCDSLEKLSAYIQSCLYSPLILCIRHPHEHVSLLYALRVFLQNRRVLVIADDFYYNDRLMLKGLGVTPLETMQLSSLLTGVQDVNHPLTCFVAHFEQDVIDGEICAFDDIVCNNAQELLAEMNRWMVTQMNISILSFEEIMVLIGVCNKQSLTSISHRLNLHLKKVSVYKIRALHKLGMYNHDKVILRGVFLHANLQCTSFISRKDFISLAEKYHRWSC